MKAEVLARVVDDNINRGMLVKDIFNTKTRNMFV